MESTEEKKEEQPAPEDLAAQDYIVLIKKWQDIVEHLTLREMKKVMQSLMEFPFSETHPTFNNKKEIYAFNIGMQIQDVKFVLMKSVFEMKKNEIENILQGDKNESIQDQIQGQESGTVAKEPNPTS